LIAVISGHQNWAEAILTEFVQRAGSVRSGYGAAALELIRGVVEGDEGRLRTAAETARDWGSVPDLLTVCLALGELSADPTPWLHEAHTIASSLGAVPAQGRVRALMRSRGVVSPRTDDDRTQLSVTEAKIIELILQGRTNRQISVALQVTQKTIEYYLSRLFAKTGCRSRIDLAAAKVRGLLSA
jgi:DNA-binding CsgD family transcriptional regulator